MSNGWNIKDEILTMFWYYEQELKLQKEIIHNLKLELNKVWKKYNKEDDKEIQGILENKILDLQLDLQTKQEEYKITTTLFNKIIGTMKKFNIY